MSTDVSLPPNSRPRILVADDEGALLTAIRRTLADAGFDVTVAGDGNEAVRLLNEQSFDVILSDLRMPGASGVDLLKAARVRDLEVPVLLMTGSPDLASATEAIRYGACEYLVKPIPLAQITKAARKAVGLRALAQAKRDSIRLFDPAHAEAGDRVGLEVTLQRALASLWIAYQPIVLANSGEVYAYEALLRSDEPTLPHPGAVLDAAARLGRLLVVGRAVRRLAPVAMANAGAEALLFVNLHVSDLVDDELGSPESPLTAMASRVVLEITERNSLDSIPDVRERVARLREVGFRIAIDDLGAGYAGLSSFAHLEPEFVKLDMSLVRDVHKVAVKRKLVRSMTTLCKDMGIVVVAEGIETAEERDAVTALGCDLLQGYLFAKPGRAFPKVNW